MAKTKTKARLEDIKVDEVSLVDRAANKKRFLIVKSEEGSMADKNTTDVDVDDDLAEAQNEAEFDREFGAEDRAITQKGDTDFGTDPATAASASDDADDADAEDDEDSEDEEPGEADPAPAAVAAPAPEPVAKTAPAADPVVTPEAPVAPAPAPVAPAPAPVAVTKADVEKLMDAGLSQVVELIETLTDRVVSLEKGLDENKQIVAKQAAQISKAAKRKNSPAVGNAAPANETAGRKPEKVRWERDLARTGVSKEFSFDDDETSEVRQ